MDTVLLVNYLKPIICLPVLSTAVEFAELTVTVDIPEEEPFPAKQIIIPRQNYSIVITSKRETLRLRHRQKFLHLGTAA